VSGRRLPLGRLLLGAALLLLLLALILEGLNGRLTEFGGQSYGAALIALTFTGMGALVVSRQPGNAVGWIFVVVGLLQALNLAADAYSQFAAVTHPASLPGGYVLAWLAEWNWAPSVALVGTFLLLLFPDGKLLSRRWRWAAWPTGVAIAVLVALAAIVLWPERRDIALGNDVTEQDVATGLIAVAAVAGVVLALGAIASAASLVVRFRRSAGVERQQLKWFTFAGGFAAVSGILLFLPISPASDAIGVVFFAGALSIPVAAGIAILRYRLYDIDVVVNRTLVYASVTALLACSYLGLVLLLQLAFSPITEENSLAVALSTLAVAGLFRPARNRVQALVDRRFYRRKYDAQRTLEGFAAHLREEVDLDALRAELTGVVAVTMQPAHVSLWLRKAER
jgi:hypothetical protein